MDNCLSLKLPRSKKVRRKHETKLNPYINFKDNARESMQFYHLVFGGINRLLSNTLRRRYGYHQGSLPKTGRGSDQRQRTAQALPDPFLEPRSRHQVGPGERQAQFGID